ncbi:MAG: tetratricopeptide repeat protein [Caldilineaceae bacterium]
MAGLDIFQRQYGRAADILVQQIELSGPMPLTAEMHSRLYAALANGCHLPQMWASTQRLLRALTPKLELSSQRTDWLPYLHAIAAQCQTLHDVALEAACALHIGHLYYLGGEYKPAQSWLEQARAHFERLADRHGQARALNMLAWVALRTGNSATAAELANGALDRLDAHDTERAHSFYTLGEVAILQQEWTEAEAYMRQSLRFWEDAGDKRGVARGLRNLGPVLVNLQDPDAAIACYERAMALFTEINDASNLAITQMNLGIAYRKRNEHQAALQLYTQAAGAFRQMQDHLNLAKVYTNMGILLRMLGQYHAAAQIQNEAIALWRKLDNRRSLCNVLDGLGQTLMLQGQWDAAADVFQEAVALLAADQNDATCAGLYDLLRAHLQQATTGIQQQQEPGITQLSAKA